MKENQMGRRSSGKQKQAFVRLLEGKKKGLRDRWLAQAQANCEARQILTIGSPNFIYEDHPEEERNWELQETLEEIDDDIMNPNDELESMLEKEDENNEL